MEKAEEQQLENHVPVEVTRTCMNDKTNEILNLEDSNRNITIIPSKEELSLKKIDLIQNCEANLKDLNLKSPNGLCNGVDNVEDLSYCSKVLVDSSSHCERVVNCESDVPSASCGNAEHSSVEESSPSRGESSSDPEEVQYVSYVSELQMPDIMSLIQKDLSEPYSIYTYRYFIHNWPQLCFLVS